VRARARARARVCVCVCVFNKYDIIFMELHLRNGRLKIVGFFFLMK